MKPFAIEPLESRLFLSAAPSSETNIGSFSRNRSVTVKQLVDSSNTTHTFKFGISGNTAKIVTFKINKPKHTSFQFDLSDSHGDYGSPRQIILGVGTYSVLVDADASASKYSLNVRSSNAVRNAKTAKPKPVLTASVPLTATIPVWLDAPILSMPTVQAVDPSTLAISYFDATTLAQGEPQLTGVTLTSGIILSNPTYADSGTGTGTGIFTLANGSGASNLVNNGATAVIVRYTHFGDTDGAGTLSLDSGSGSITKLGTGTLVLGNGETGTADILTDTSAQGTLSITGSTITVGGMPNLTNDNFTSGRITLTPGSTLSVSSSAVDLTQYGLDLSTLTLPANAKIVLQQPISDQLTAIQSNPNLQLAQNDDGSCTITAAPPADSTTTDTASSSASSPDPGSSGTSDPSTAASDSSQNLNS